MRGLCLKRPTFRIATESKTPFREEEELDRLHLINVFVAVVDTQGFAGASRKLNLSPPAVTRAINELEAHLGVRLLTRTTRIVKVTEAGARYAEDCRAVLSQLNEADESASGLHGSPRGRLTITAPVGFGAMYVTPVVTEYLDRYPEVTVSCWFMDRRVNMLDEGVDVGVRIGALPDSSMQAIRVGRMRLLMCAAPAYLEEHGEPKSPEDLENHVVIAASGATSTSEWRISNQGTPGVVKLHPRLITTTSDTAIAAALTGFGLTNVLASKVAEHVRAGRLKTVLGDFEPPPLPVNVLHREGRHASPKARTFIDLAVERLRPQLATI
jgi:DNA-binding transcriptional LysR family regulator